MVQKLGGSAALPFFFFSFSRKWALFLLLLLRYRSQSKKAGSDETVLLFGLAAEPGREPAVSLDPASCQYRACGEQAAGAEVAAG